MLFVPAYLVMIGLLLAINHYRKINHENDNRALCRANLVKIHKAIIQYENEFKTIKPKSLELLVELGRLSAIDLKCPSASSKNGSDYIYCAALPLRNPKYWYRMSSEPAEAVLAYDHTTNHGVGINALFRDGAAEFLELGDQNTFANAMMREVEAGYYPISPAEYVRTASTQPAS